MRKSIIVLGISYLIVILIIAVGFFVGNGYSVYDNPRAAVIHSSSYWKELYGFDRLEEMFDGCINKYEGWYGFSWKNTYSTYAKPDVPITDEKFNQYCYDFCNLPDGYTEWSEREYVEYISDRNYDREYVWIKLNGEVVFVEGGSIEEDYEGTIPIIIAICVALLILPAVIFFIHRHIKRKTTLNINV